MQTYELTYIVSPEASSQEIQEITTKIKSTITEKGGSILKQPEPIAKTLSYPIKGKGSGFLCLLEFQLEPENIIEVKNIIEETGSIVRNMISIKETADLKTNKRSKDFLDRIESPNKQAEKPFSNKPTETETNNEAPAINDKIDLKDIDQKLEEILG